MMVAVDRQLQEWIGICRSGGSHVAGDLAELFTVCIILPFLFSCKPPLSYSCQHLALAMFLVTFPIAFGPICLLNAHPYILGPLAAG